MTREGARETVSLKKALRAQCRALEKEMSPEERAGASARMARQVLELPEYQASRILFTFISEPQEPDTRAILRDALTHGKTVAAPRCDSAAGVMRFYAFASLEELVPGCYGIPEPPPAAAEVEPREGFALVPALCFDMDGVRLGRGKGYYDRFLAGFGGFSAGLCFEHLLMEGPLPREAHDRPVDAVVTERRLLRPAK